MSAELWVRSPVLGDTETSSNWNDDRGSPLFFQLSKVLNRLTPVPKKRNCCGRNFSKSVPKLTVTKPQRSVTERRSSWNATNKTCQKTDFL